MQKRILLIAASLAFAGVASIAGTASAAVNDGDAPFASITGTCRNWSVTYGLGSQAPAAERFQLRSGTFEGDLLIEGDMQPGDVNTYNGHFTPQGYGQVVDVWADGAVVAAKIFPCGATSANHRVRP